LHLLLYFCTAPLRPCNGRPVSFRDDDVDDDVAAGSHSSDIQLKYVSSRRICLPESDCEINWEYELINI